MVCKHFSAPSDGFVQTNSVVTTDVDRSCDCSTGALDSEVVFHG
jgi:hypothetical protein